MKKSYIYILAVCLVLTVTATIYLYYLNKNSEDNNLNKTDTSMQDTEEIPFYTGDEVVEEDTYTLEQVAEHSSSNDCWIVISEQVYDVTNYVNTHPGGEALLSGCGKDAGELFETRPSGSGTPHSQDAYDLLKDYYLGNL